MQGLIKRFGTLAIAAGLMLSGLLLVEALLWGLHGVTDSHQLDTLRENAARLYADPVSTMRFILAAALTRR